jgi:hypothetical protein
MSEQGFPRMFTYTVNGWQFRVQFQTNPNQDEPTVKSDMLRDGRPLTKRERELWRPWLASVAACIVKNLAEANGDEKLAAYVTKWNDDHEKARISVCRATCGFRNGLEIDNQNGTSLGYITSPGHRLSACLAIDLPQQPTSRLLQAQPPKAGQ